MDIVDVVYKKLIVNDYIKSQTYIRETDDYRIKFYEYPETGDITGPYIIIDPLDDGKPVNYADNKWTKLDFLLQVEVWSSNRKTTLHLSQTIRDLMWSELGFHQIKGPNEYDKGIYRNANRYRGTLYRDDFETI